jgi:hypothetical protein
VIADKVNAMLKNDRLPKEVREFAFWSLKSVGQLNMETMAIVSKCLRLEFDYDETTEYFHEVTDKVDHRNLINGKKDTSIFEPYTQVFGDKHDFINNLSILDLLFNEGRFALDYLKNQTL